MPDVYTVASGYRLPVFNIITLYIAIEKNGKHWVHITSPHTDEGLAAGKEKAQAIVDALNKVQEQ